jgi:hypothetical protein
MSRHERDLPHYPNFTFLIPLVLYLVIAIIPAVKYDISPPHPLPKAILPSVVYFAMGVCLRIEYNKMRSFQPHHAMNA